jgi:hypothetical protein
VISPVPTLATKLNGYRETKRPSNKTQSTQSTLKFKVRRKEGTFLNFATCDDLVALQAIQILSVIAILAIAFSISIARFVAAERIRV